LFLLTHFSAILKTIMLKRNLFFLFSVTVVSLASVVLCIYNYNPYSASNYQFLIFYLSLLGGLFGILSTLIFYLRIAASKKEMVYAFFAPSLRRGFFIAVAITSVLALKGMGLFDLWVIIPLFIIILLLELFFQTKKTT